MSGTHPHSEGKLHRRISESWRPYVKGKSLVVREEKLFVKGVTYGPFGAHNSDAEYGGRERARRDFATMAKFGINSIRTYTVPPLWLLDAAYEFRLRVMVGLPWEQHVAFLDDGKLKRTIIKRVRDSVAKCRQHPAILCYAIGN